MTLGEIIKMAQSAPDPLAPEVERKFKDNPPDGTASVAEAAEYWRTHDTLYGTPSSGQAVRSLLRTFLRSAEKQGEPWAVMVINHDEEDERLFLFPSEAEARAFEKRVDDAEQNDGWDTTVLYAVDECTTADDAYWVWKRMQGGLA